MERRKIALIIDSEGWAFDNEAQQIKKYINEYDFDIIPGRIFEGNMIKLFLFCEEYDLIHFIWRGYLSLIDRKAMEDYAIELGTTLEEFKQKYIYNKKITFSICDHLYLDGKEKWRTDEIMKYGKAYLVLSKKLFDIYSEFPKKPSVIAQDGIDISEYKPNNLERLKNIDTLIVGWAGNSKFVWSDGDDDMKGVNGIIKPAVEELKEEGYKIELKLADRNLGMIDHKDMPNYYNNIDLYVCASRYEGTPNPILESMAMGLPIISTNVGIVEEVFGTKQKEFIMKERSKECLKDNLKRILENKSILQELSKENIQSIKKWDWKNITPIYKKFFEANMQ